MQKIHTILLSLLLLFAASCETEIEVDLPPYRPKLVVNCSFNNLDSLFAEVSYSRSVLDTSVDYFLNDAEVKLFDGTNTYTLTYNSFTGKYTTGVVPQSGKVYTITAAYPGFLPVSATSSLPSQALQLQTSWRDSAAFDSLGAPIGEIKVAFVDDGNSANSYKILLFYYDDIRLEFFPLRPESDDVLAGEDYRTADGGLFFSDITFNGRAKEFKFRTPFGLISQGQTTKFLVVIESYSDELTKYERTLQTHLNTANNPFAEPARVYSNVTNGLGIFAGKIIVRDTI